MTSSERHPNTDLSSSQAGFANSKVVWTFLVLIAFSFWTSSLTPGLYLSDSFGILGQMEIGGYETAFSYLYQIPFKTIHGVGLSVRMTALTIFLFQMFLFFGVVYWIGLYILRQGLSRIFWIPLILTLANPVFPVMYSLISVNIVANLFFVVFAFLNYRRVRSSGSENTLLDLSIVFLGAVLVALRLDMVMSVLLSYLLLLRAKGRDTSNLRRRGKLLLGMTAAIIIFNVILPRVVGFHASFKSYALTLIYRPLDKMFANDPTLLNDPAVTGPIEAIIRMPASKIVGHGEEVYWWDIDRNPSDEAFERQLAVFFTLVGRMLHVFVGDRASLLIELLGSPRTFFYGDSLVIGRDTPFEKDIQRWGLRDLQFPYSPWVKDRLTLLQSDWSPAEPRYWLWNELPYFVLILCAASLYGFAPATAFMALLIAVRMVVLATTAPFGFYFYGTSTYLVGLLMVAPFFWAEYSSRRSSPTLSEKPLTK